MTPAVDPIDARVGDLSPKAKLVYLVLAEHGSLTHLDVMRATRASEATVHRALVELQEAGVVEHHYDPLNPNTHVYHLTNRETRTNV